ncbi:peptidase M23 [Flavobacterium sp. 316]|uniref:Peptidoglycan DD-metalloendopeptidase family protein n=1 Tax=Flavobacterium sediminilitoris TaxID=2024526 RepID=A0ABY4HQ86_9FLAO|nr:MULTISPECIES: peptidoglycan DD-metalloendopeptidase family protein [Flavobacterium]KIX21205.1 peptidase M23 [Flavobacterium sp. 316]UOX35039.1 peptidoglycan DD-metalloendopeptidase family protein [Flavobacterium sediminilitoris]
MNRILILLFSLLMTNFMFAQTSSEQQKLEARKEQITKEIAAFKALLQGEKKKEKSVLSQIAEQKARIRLSEKLISTTAKQMRLLDDDIYLKQLEINKLNRELKVLKEDYAKMIVKSYKSRNDQSRVMFVLSSQNFLQAYKRIQYMKQYASFRKMQGEEIVEKQDKLTEAKAKQEASKKNKAKALADNQAEKIELEKQKAEQEKLAKEFQKNKKKYAAEIDKKEKERKEIDKQIKKLIAEAIAAANKKNATKTGVKSSGSSSKFDLTPEGKLVSDNFKANKGKLPWPVEKGYVYLKYGDQPHPVHSNLTVHNSGVEIATEPGSVARAIFDGEVLQIQLIKGSNKKVVLIQHGDFITIYQNLESVNVKEGDKVTRKQNLGRIQTDPSGKAILKFMVSQNANTLNPEQWLSNM